MTSPGTDPGEVVRVGVRSAADAVVSTSSVMDHAMHLVADDFRDFRQARQGCRQPASGPQRRRAARSLIRIGLITARPGERPLACGSKRPTRRRLSPAQRGESHRVSEIQGPRSLVKASATGGGLTYDVRPMCGQSARRAVRLNGTWEVRPERSPDREVR